MTGRVTSSRVTVRPGYWGTCTAYTKVATARDQPSVMQAKDADTATQALIWIQVALRTLVSALAPDEAERTYVWLARGQLEALSRLQRSSLSAFAVAVQDTRVEWTARRVLFLPQANRDAGPLPPCAHRFVCTSTDPDHACGSDHG